MSDRAFDRINHQAHATIMGELRYKKAEADRARLVRDLVESRQHIRDKVRQAIDQAEAVAVEEEFKAFHRYIIVYASSTITNIFHY